MKFYLITIAATISLSSCLKQSIPDAMLNSENSSGQGNVTATLSYKVNGNPVNLTVADAKNQDPTGYTLGCSKESTYYDFDAVTSAGEFTFMFLTDTLTTGNYNITGNLDFFITEYNGTNDYLQSATDSIGFTVTSSKNGLISGTFSGRLTPLISQNYPNDIYGTPSSVLITEGSFKNVPVFY
ncbi:MAG TPA: hypothetical protein VK787_16580 [Puia sp.]|jgi:hypothetical protein|nr:hypothetical protein [Puia sp.]